MILFNLFIRNVWLFSIDDEYFEMLSLLFWAIEKHKYIMCKSVLYKSYYKGKLSKIILQMYSVVFLTLHLEINTHSVFLWHSVTLGTQSTWHSVSLVTHSVSLALGLLGTQSDGTRSLGTRSPWHSVSWHSCLTSLMLRPTWRRKNTHNAWSSKLFKESKG